MQLLLWLLISFIIIYFLTTDWKNSLFIILILFPFESFIRKYIYDYAAIYLVKDFCFIIIYSIYIFLKIQKREEIITNSSVSTPLIVLFLISLASFFNPDLSNKTIGLMGLRTLFIYIPLFYLVPKVISDQKKLFLFLFLLIIISLPVSILGILQYFAGPMSALNVGHITPYPGQLTVRPTSIFLHNGGFGQYIYILVLLNFVIVLIEKYRNTQKIITTLSFILGLISLMISGQRAGILLILIQVPIGANIIAGKFKWPIKYIRTLTILSFITAGLILLFPRHFGDAYERFSTVFTPSKSIWEDRVRAQVMRGIVATVDENPLVGHGIGTATLGTRYVVDKIGVPADYNYEVEGGIPHIFWELGIIGFIAFSWLMMSLIKYTLKTLKLIHDAKLYGIILFILMFQIGVLIWNFFAPVLDNGVMAIYFWSLSGLVACIRRLQKNKINNQRLPQNFNCSVY